MPTKHEILNIPAVIHACEDILKQYHHSTDNFVIFIRHINNRLKRVEEIITNQQQLTYLNQSDLIVQAINQYESTLSRASVEIIHLLTEIKEYGNSNHALLTQVGDKRNNDKFELLKYAHLTLSLILQKINTLLIRIDTKNISHLEYYYRSAFRLINLLEMTASFKGRFLPFAQAVDPFLGFEFKSDKTLTVAGGGCHGYARGYANDISISGKINSFPFYKTSIHIEQNQQDEFAFKNKFIMYQLCDDTTDFRDYIFKLLVNSNRDEMFLLTLVFPKLVHELFYRYIEYEGLFEFVDPNTGAFVFDNIENFINWCAAYLMEVYFDDISLGDRGGALALRSLGKQPVSSTACIQPFLVNSHDYDVSYQFNYKQIYSIAETAKLQNKCLEPFNKHYHSHILNAHLLKFLFGTALSGLFLLALILKSTTTFNADYFGIPLLICSLPFMFAAGFIGAYSGFMVNKLKDKIHENGIINKQNYQDIAINIKQQRKDDKKPSIFSLFNVARVDIIDKYSSIEKPIQSKVLTV